MTPHPAFRTMWQKINAVSSVGMNIVEYIVTQPGSGLSLQSLPKGHRKAKP